MNKIIGFLKTNKNVLIAITICLAAFITFNTFSVQYHRKEIKALTTQMADKQKLIDKTIAEKKIFQDSALWFKNRALLSDKKIADLNIKIIIVAKERDAAIKQLENMSSEGINSFIAKRYYEVPKSGIDLQVDKNVGNKIVIELVEKDYLTEEVGLVKQSNILLSGQVDTLKTSIGYFEQSLAKADSALAMQIQQLQTSEDINKLLKQDLKKAKRKVFWGAVESAAVGVGTGILIGVLLL